MADFLANLAAHHDSAWAKAEGYEKQERPIQAVKKILVSGAVDVVFIQNTASHMVVAGEDQDTISRVQTRFEGGTLVIESEGISISSGGLNIHVSGSGNVFAGGTINFNGRNGGFNLQQKGRAIVAISLPKTPGIQIMGSGDVTLYGLSQSSLDLRVQGSGDITASGTVDHLIADIAGSGDIDVTDLISNTADLRVAGSGDIKAFVKTAVKAQIAGSGDIVIRGNPGSRDHSVVGSGDIKFKKS